MTAPDPATDAEIVAADLPTIPLASGERVPVEGGMANVWLVEKRFGSLGGLYRHLGALDAGPSVTVEEALSRAMFGPVVEALACFMPRGPLRDAEELAEHLAAKDAGEFGAALGEVFRVAFPQDKTPPPEPSTADGPGNGPEPTPPMAAGGMPAPWTPGRPTLSPGVTSGTPGLSSSAAPTPSSGS
jgi:hypothetical protein